MRDAFNKFPDFFVQAFKIIVESALNKSLSVDKPLDNINWNRTEC